ncbi:nuclear speckle splicing regulatory protein 1 [Chiloscyllium plagiosum]|uniref:nuclear speckle splicing regulatory protein 1 n=1 Tax=Chiloscyllium plagiosum TaxID=36176 RepID=UPI001CB7B6A8|nr:nuclear speckle splicing regulatory protein 1 [Chiloscyllium plagiosum]
MAVPVRQYGLILPKKTKNTVALSKHFIFDDSDDETSVNETLRKESLKKTMMKQTKLEIQKALEEDSTVYEYDSIYDELQQKKLESSTKLLSGTNKKPKYIDNLLKAVGERKKEQDRRMERKIQKEREAEGEKYMDKDAFVTSAYKKKLQEQAEEKEQERREAEREASLDVTKQKDLSGFYRHFLNQKVGEESIPECSIRGTKGVKEEQSVNYPNESDCQNPAVISRGSMSVNEQNPDADSDFEIDSEDDKAKNGQRKLASKTRNDDSSDNNEEKGTARQYRRHVGSSSEEEQSHHQHMSYSHKEGKSEKSKRHSKSYRDKEKSFRNKESSGHKAHSHVKGKYKEKDHHRKEREHERYKDGKEQKRIKEEKCKDKDYNSGRDVRHRDYGEKHKERDEQTDEKLQERERSKMEKYAKKNDRRKEEKYREHKEEGKWDKIISEREKEKDTFERTDKKYGSSDMREDSSEKEKHGKHDHKRALSEEKKIEELSVETRDNEEKGKSMNLLSEQKPKDDTEKQIDGAAMSQPVSKFVKRSNQETITSAKERYLARQMNRALTKSYIEPEETD